MVPLWLLLHIVAGNSMPVVLGYMFTSKRDMAQNKELCTSPVCENRAEQIISSLDVAADPCEDFYAYACGKSYSSSYWDLSEALFQKLLGILESWPEMTKAQNATEKAIMLYQACKRSFIADEQELAAIKKILHEEGYSEWPLLTRKEATEAKKFNTVEDVILSTETGGLFQVQLGPSTLTKETAVLYFRETALLYIQDDGSYDISISPNSPRPLETKSQRNATAEDLKEIGIKCARIKAGVREIKKSININETDTETTIANLESLVPSLSLLKVINSIVKIANVTLSRDDHVVIHQPRFFTEYLKYLAKQNPDDIYNCLGMNRANEMLSYLPPITKERVPFYCLTRVKLWCAPLLTGLYVMHESDIHLRRTEARSLLNNIGNAMYTNLQFVPWFDHKTRRRAILKLKNFTPFVGFSDIMFNETLFPLFYANVRPLHQNDTASEIYAEFERKNKSTAFRYLRKGAEAPRWSDGAYDEVNAHYISVSNSMEVLDGILGGLYFQSGLPRYVNLGSIGSVMGHELTHGFDTEGRRFDETGEIFDWWSNYTREDFTDKAACFVKQYGSIVDQKTKKPIDGKLTLVENIADNGGIRLAHKAFRTHELQSTDIGLPGLENFTSEQLFFISSALIWCGGDLTSDGTQSPVKYRVNVPLQNMEEFSAAFQCKKGSHMRLGDHERCILW